MIFGDIIRTVLYSKDYASAHRYVYNEVRHAFPSFAMSSDDEEVGANNKLLKLAIDSFSGAIDIDLSDIAKRFPPLIAKNILNWPGNHYRFLAALTQVLLPIHIVGIGTDIGASVLSMKKYLGDNGRITSYDIRPWKSIPGQRIAAHDLGDQLSLKTGDIAKPSYQNSEAHIFRTADLIFIDASHDGETEKRILTFIASLDFLKSPIVVLDDIRLPALLPLWRSINRPKFDATSMAHWSGTGIIDWNSYTNVNGIPFSTTTPERLKASG